MGCCNSSKPIVIPGECQKFNNIVNSIYVNPKTMEAYDEDGNFIGKVDLKVKDGIVVVDQIKKDAEF